MSRQHAVRPIAVALLAAAVLVAGCSSKKDGASSSVSNTPTITTAPASVSPSAPGASNSAAVPEISGDPQAVTLFNEALQALDKVSSVHLKGSGTDSGEAIGLDLSFAKDKGATGSVSVNGGTLQLVSTTDAVYIQADAKSFAALGAGDVPPDALNAIAGKWLKISSADAASSGPFGDFAAFTNLNSLTEAFAPSGKVSLLPGKKTINGKTAVGIVDSGDTPDDGSIVYVEDGGDHLPLAVVPGGASASASASSSASSTGEIDFIDYNKPVTITAPTSSIDISQLMALMASPSS